MKFLVFPLLPVLILSGCVNNNSPVQSSSSGNSSEAIDETSGTTEPADRTIAITAKRFQFSPNLVRVKKGERIRFEVDNTDTIHDFFIPELNVSSNEVIQFDEVGEYSFSCANFCGEGHVAMGGTILVEE